MFGNAFTCNGDQSAGENVTTVAIDLIADSFAAPDYFIISGLSGADITKLDGTRAVWNEVLKGEDTFDLGGLSQTQIGAWLNVIFGDDFASAASFAVGVVTNSGGNGSIIDADNKFDMTSDTLTGAGRSVPALLPYSTLATISSPMARLPRRRGSTAALSVWAP